MFYDCGYKDKQFFGNKQGLGEVFLWQRGDFEYCCVILSCCCVILSCFSVLAPMLHFKKRARCSETIKITFNN